MNEELITAGVEALEELYDAVPSPTFEQIAAAILDYYESNGYRIVEGEERMNGQIVYNTSDQRMYIGTNTGTFTSMVGTWR